MAKNKKYKNVTLEQKELEPTAIGMFENNRKSGSIGTFVILTIFILFVLYLPEITEFVDNYMNKPTNIEVRPVTPTPTEPVIPPEVGDDENFIKYIDNLRISNDEILVSNIVVDKNNYKISYSITNNLDVTQNIKDLNYYLELFNTEEMFMERVKITNDLTLDSGAFAYVERDLTAEAATTIGYLSLEKKNVTDYPEVDITEVGGIGNLVCSKEHEKITYKFQAERLKEVVSEVSYISTDANYDAILEQNKTLANNYAIKPGITSSLFEYVGGYNITTTVNLNDADSTNLFSGETFKVNTTPSVVKFEIEAQGFKCE